MLALTVYAGLLALASPTSGLAGEKGVGFYCGINVKAHTDCANVSGGSWSNGYFDSNQAIVSPEIWYSCEHTYIYGGGTTASDRCGTGLVTSLSDLYCDYVSGIKLSGHVGNDTAVELPTYGATGFQTDTCI